MNWNKRIDEVEPSWVHFIGIMVFGVLLAVAMLPVALFRAITR